MIKAGDTLPNGATVIATDSDKVLANFRDEYVTWKMDKDYNCYWGHYFQKDFGAASKDYANRK